MAIAAMGASPTVADSEDDDEDKDLFLDWRGKDHGAGAKLLQQSLGFKQVKHRPPDAVKTMIAKQHEGLRRDEKKRSEVNTSYENVVFVSLSDDEDPHPARKARKDIGVVPTSVQHAGPKYYFQRKSFQNRAMLNASDPPHVPEDVVCLDSDSDTECPSISIKGEGSAKFGNREGPVVRRSWERTSFSVEVRVNDTGPCLSNPYKVIPQIAESKGGRVREDASSAKLEECSKRTWDSSKLDSLSSPPRINASPYENAVRSSDVLARQETHAGSHSRVDTTEIEYKSSEERILSFSKIFEGTGADDNSIARSLRRQYSTAGTAPALTVYDFHDETVQNSKVVSGVQGPALKKCSEKPFASTSVKSRARNSKEKLNLASNIIIQDLTTSDNDDESRDPCCSVSSDRNERMAKDFETSDLYCGERHTWRKNCAQSQECLRPGKLSRVAGIGVDKLSLPEGSISGQLHAFGDTGGSSEDEHHNSTQVSNGHTSVGLASATLDSRVPLCDYTVSDEEDIAIQVSSKRKCVRSAEDPLVEEGLLNIGTLDVDIQTTNLPLKRAKGRKRPSIDKASSASDAAKAVIGLGRLEKQRQREREQEARNKLKEEDKTRRQEENRKKKEELRQQKEAAKAEAAERKKIEQECGKWKKGKFALENTTVYIDKRIIESKTLGPPLLQQLADKLYTYQVVTNRVEKTVVWTMKMPSEDSKAILDARESQDEPVSNSQVPLEEVEVKYVVVLMEAAEFADMVGGDAVDSHISRIKKEHPGYTICYLLNNLTRYIQKKEQNQYRTGDRSWKRPNVELVLAELITHYTGVRSRICIDENEMAEHIIGLTRSLAECPFKPKLTSLTINANGEHIAKNDPNRDVIKRDPWKKVLATIPNITGAAVVAITKLYPTMRALLNAYLDPTKTVLEKEFLLQDIVKDAALGSARAEGRRVGPVCSKRIYRLLMAQNGNLRTEAAEEGEDYFRDQQC